MNILGTCRHLLSYLSMGSSPAKSEAEPAADNDNDGPGAGGGYNDSVDLSDVESSSKKGPETVSPSDGPGAGGGYDDDDADTDTDSDGPGAGGGYNPGAGGGYFNSTNFLGQQWLMGPPAPKAANSNKKPAAKTNEGKAE